MTHASENKRRSNYFEFVAGWPCLDFANTASAARQPPDERLRTYQDLVAWACLAGLLSGEAGQQLAAQAARHPADAREALANARALRLVICRVFSAVAHGAPADPADLNALNNATIYAARCLRIRQSGEQFTWGWQADNVNLNQVLRPIAWSAAQLLTTPGTLARVRRCQARDCSWLFLDRSPNRSRRWCSMSRCGGRAKWRKYYDGFRALPR